jgi:hypothetical protein
VKSKFSCAPSLYLSQLSVSCSWLIVWLIVGSAMLSSHPTLWNEIFRIHTWIRRKYVLCLNWDRKYWRLYISCFNFSNLQDGIARFCTQTTNYRWQLNHNIKKHIKENNHLWFIEADVPKQKTIGEILVLVDLVYSEEDSIIHCPC